MFDFTRGFKVLVFVAVFAAPAFGMTGKVVLSNGSVLEGDIVKNPDGSCWVTMKNGSIKFEREEIKKVRIHSTTDRVSERFLSSYKVTPGRGGSAVRKASPYDHIINREAKRNSIDPALVKAVIKAESNFNNCDVSCKGACGLMQLMPRTARVLEVEEMFDPEQNIRGGTRYLSDMLDLFNGDTELALAAYNAGPGAVRRYNSVPPYRETREYIRKINRYYRQYKGNKEIYTFVDEEGRLNIYNDR